MKVLVFSESAGFRKQIEDLLSHSSHQVEARGLNEILDKSKDLNFDATFTDYESWQRCASVFRYFDCLDTLNQKPLMFFSKNRKAPALKLRRARSFTTHCPLPLQNEEFQAAMQQLSSQAA
ncbi:MAG TPA: hypothetical protein DCQ83_09275 [Fibrobacteres bacterium]|jgi:hypothetical protein|nr:hypothetical protein [Fibrobacterota bacterium]